MATDSNSNLKLTQLKAISALLSEPDVKAAAKKAGVGERTLHAWLHSDSDFRAAVDEAVNDAIAGAVRSLAGVSSKAIAALVGVLDDPSIAPGVRVRAAAVALDQLARFRQLADIEEQLTLVLQKLEAIEHEKL